MRTVFTTVDIKNILSNAFSSNTEDIILTDENGTKTKEDIVSYLNIDFYSWKDRQNEVVSSDYDYLNIYQDWLASLENSMERAFALVEFDTIESIPSVDMENGDISGRITFLIQSNKIENLDYYMLKLRNKYLGASEKLQNMYGDVLTAYITFGILSYEDEPFDSAFGEMIIAQIGFRINYLEEALGYDGTTLQISLDGDDLYDESGNIVDSEGSPTTTKYLEMPVIKDTMQAIFSGDPVPVSVRPDLTGLSNKSLTMTDTISFFDYNKTLSKQINEVFYSKGAYSVNGILTTVQDINIPVYIRVIVDGNSYVYKMVITNIEKARSNGEFNITSLSIKTWASVYGEE